MFPTKFLNNSMSQKLIDKFYLFYKVFNVKVHVKLIKNKIKKIYTHYVSNTDQLTQYLHYTVIVLTLHCKVG